MELIDLNPDILLKLASKEYNYFVCSLLNDGYNTGQEMTRILLTPIKSMIEGFNILPALNKASYLVDIKEIAGDLKSHLPENEDVIYLIDKNITVIG